MSKCQCKIGVKAGDYANTVNIKQPEWSKGHFAIDVCISEELQQLWSYGIKTVGSCCGHHIAPPYIQPKTIEDAASMRERGYIVVVLRSGNLCAKPKSIDWDTVDWVYNN